MDSPRAIVAAPGPAPDPAWGVFETLLCAGGRLLELDAHLARLDSSVRELYGRPARPEARELLLEQALRAPALARVRITVGPGPAAEARCAAVDPALVLPGWGDALRLEPVAIPGGVGAHKWADRRRLEAAEAACAAAVPLVLDADGTVLEASRGNVFAVTGGALVTPPVDGRILPGVTRAVVCALAAERGLAVHERPLALDELLAADEALVTGAVRGVEPVAAIPGRDWAPGPVTAELAGALRDRWRAPE